MSKKLSNILLLVSLAFNLAVVAAFIYMTVRGPHHHHRTRPRPDTESYRHRDRDSTWADSDSIRALRTTFRETKHEFMTELAKEPINEPALNTILERSLSEQSLLERELGKRLIERRKEMSPEEAEEFFNRRAERLRRFSERIDRMNRRNRDGDRDRYRRPDRRFTRDQEGE